MCCLLNPPSCFSPRCPALLQAGAPPGGSAAQQQWALLQGGPLDPALLAALPPDIQQELRAAQLHEQGRGQGQGHRQGRQGGSGARAGKGRKRAAAQEAASQTRSIKTFFKPT
jgi:hypothetical protein